MSEDLLRDPPGSFGLPGEAISIKLEFAHLARPGESPEQHVGRLRKELARLRAVRPSKLMFRTSTLQFQKTERIQEYLQKIREVEEAAGLPVPGAAARTRSRKSAQEQGAASEAERQPRKRANRKKPS